MPELLASDVIIVEEEPTIKSLPTLPTAVIGGVGVTEMGPFGPTLTTSYREFRGYYGRLTADADLTLAAMGAFLNGATLFWSVRVVHMTDYADPATRTSAQAEVNLTTTGAETQGSVTSTESEPFEFTEGDTLIASINGGGNATATYDAAAASVTGSGGTYPTGWSSAKTFLYTIDDGSEKTANLSGADLSLAQVIDELNPQLDGAYADNNGGELRIVSDRKGTGSRVRIGAGTANAALGFAGTEDVSGTGDVSDISAVTGAEIKTVFEADVAGSQVTVETDGKVTFKTATVGAGGSIQFDATSTAETKIGVDTALHEGTPAGAGNMGKLKGKYHGTYANSFAGVVAAASNGDANYFNLEVRENGSPVENTLTNLSTVLTDPRYWVTIVNAESKFLSAEDLLAGTPPGNRPTNGTYILTGGGDGLASLDDNDFIGSEAGPTGLYELDQVENLSLLIVPNRATAAVQQAMLTYCDTHRNKQVFAILDPPAGLSAVQMRTWVKTTVSIYRYSAQGAIYWPRLKIANPAKDVYTSDADGMITVPPCGHAVGVYARVDASKPGGVYVNPGGVRNGQVIGVLGFENDEVLDKRKRAILEPELINVITTPEGYSGVYLWGSATLDDEDPFPSIPQRRGVSYISRTIRIGLTFALHVNNTRKLRMECSRTVKAFLRGEWQKDGLIGATQAQAFTVDFSDELNPASERRKGKLNGRIKLATPVPTKWVYITIGEDESEILAELAA